MPRATYAQARPGGATIARPAARGGEAQRFGNRRLQSLLRSESVHAKRAMSEPGDADERAAEALSQRVLAGPANAGPTCFDCAPSAPCATCGVGTIMRRSVDGAGGGHAGGGHAGGGHAGGGHAGGDPTAALGAGRPLDRGSRAFFEPRFGVGLGEVRIHDDEQANQAATSIAARAFTAGQHIAFAAGEHQPGSARGRELLAHELAHVVLPPSQARVARQTMDGGVAEMDAAVEADHRPSDAGLTDGPTIPGGVPMDPLVPAHLSGPGGPCTTAEEEAERDAFALRTDLRLRRTIPSTGLGMFDADYFPLSGIMPITMRIKFAFVDADGAPGLLDQLSALFSGLDLSRFFWKETEKTDFVRDYISRVQTRWSGAHVMHSTKPCWGFMAIPQVRIIETDDEDDAHYVVTTHKSPGPDIDYRSAGSAYQIDHPEQARQADLWQSDVRENPDFNSGTVATTERLRLQAALLAAAATPVIFPQNDTVIPPAAAANLATFATAARSKNPSDPAIPLIIDGFASAEGDRTHNQHLSDARVAAVRTALSGIPQSISSTSHGPVGAPDDAANRRVDIAVDAVFESTYHGNRYSVAEHEFGHFIGNVDEYSSSASGGLGTAQTAYVALLARAGLASPAFPSQTSSQMSNGIDVLPRHYATFWEALGRMTDPAITEAEWSLR
jgi:outer membrane protein OmpA-like peptidoglycan-associated protein